MWQFMCHGAWWQLWYDLPSSQHNTHRVLGLREWTCEAHKTTRTGPRHWTGENTEAQMSQILPKSTCQTGRPSSQRETTELQSALSTAVPHTGPRDRSVRTNTIFTFFLPIPSTCPKINYAQLILLYIWVVNTNDPILDHAFWIFHLLTPTTLYHITDVLVHHFPFHQPKR